MAAESPSTTATSASSRSRLTGGESSKRITFRLSAEKHDRLVEIVESTGTPPTKSAVIRLALDQTVFAAEESEVSHE
jgi:hypothetical protein